MSRYDPNSMTRVLKLEKYDFRDKSGSESDEDESINGIFKTPTGGVSTTNTENNESGRPRSFFGMKRLGLSRKDREKDADAAAGSVKSDADSALRSSVGTNSDETYLTYGTALTGDHVNALLKAHKAYNDAGDDAENEGVENYWKATEPSTVIRDAKVLTSIPKDEEDDDIPIADRIANRGKAERRNTSNSMLTAPIDNGSLDSSGELGFGGDQDTEDEDDLMKYAVAMVRNVSIPDEGGKDHRSASKPTSTDAMLTSEIEKANKSGVKFGDDDVDEEKGSSMNYKKRNSLQHIKKFFTGSESTPSANPSETYDLRASCVVEKKKGKTWGRRASDGTTDSMWSWDDAGANIAKASERYSGRSNSNNSGDYSNDDGDDKSHSSGGTFDKSWLGLGKNNAQKSGRGGSSWNLARRITMTPFVDHDGDSFHSQRSTPYRMGERSLKRCIGIMFVLAIAVVGALVGYSVMNKEDSLGDEPLTKGASAAALTEEEKLAVAESVNEACSSSSVEKRAGRRKCQNICFDHFCCFDNDKDGYNCQDDPSKSCSVYAGCMVLVGDLMSGGSEPFDVEYVDSSTLASRVNSACSNVKTSIGKLECKKACEDHMCCVTADSSKSCRDDKKMECSAYEACAVLPQGADADKDIVTSVSDKPPSDNGLPSWDTADKSKGDDAVQTTGSAIDKESDNNELESSSGKVFMGKGDEFVPLDGTATSSEGITEKEVNSKCLDLSTAKARNKCEEMCEAHMCCFESDSSPNACISDKDCSIYGACVVLSRNVTFDSSLVLDDDENAKIMDEYDYDDDMLIVDTEEEEENYDSTVFHVGNRTLKEDLGDEKDVGAENTIMIENLDDDDFYVVDTEDEDIDAYDASLFKIGQRLLRGVFRG